MEKVWEIQPRIEKELIAQLLSNRGIVGAENIENFVNPQYSNLHDPYIFREMRKGAERIVKALQNKEKIYIYSDYDADAITANALLFRLFKILGADPDTYIPDRFSEGYGLNVSAFETIRDDGAKVVVTVDCGTNSVLEAEFCKENNIDLIITDHHEITGALPDAFALINPKNPVEQYPYDQLTGVGVAFKFACAVLDIARKEGLKEAVTLPDGFEKWFLDLVAIGTIADCHSLLGENRIMVKYGIQVMAKTKWVGLATLMQTAGISPTAGSARPLDSYAVGFIIAPRINAAGRIDHAKGAFDLLVTDDPEEAMRCSASLESLNSKRQMLTETVMSEARQQVALLSERRILLVSGNDWPKGVVGLVAGKLAEEFSKPVLVMERGAEESTGSARSVKNFNIVNALTHTKEILVKYGGHSAAAGFTLKTEHIDQFYRNLLEYAESNMEADEAVKVYTVEAEIQPEEVNPDFASTLQKFEPFGMDNPKPLFVLRDLKIESLNPVGKEQKHLQFTLSAPLLNGSSKLIKGIGFGFAKTFAGIVPGQRIDVLAEILADSWKGVVSAKLRLVDFKIKN